MNLRSVVFLLSSLLIIATYVANPTPIFADSCETLTIACAGETLGVPFEVHDADPYEPMFMVTSLLVQRVVSLVPVRCYDEWVALVAVSNMDALQPHLQYLGYHPSNAIGIIDYNDFHRLVRAGNVMTVLNQTTPTRICDIKDPQLPPCELPGGPIEIIPIIPDGSDILLLSSYKPVTNPKFCFSAEVGGTPPFDFAPKVQLPFFFVSPKEMDELKALAQPFKG